MKIKYLLRGIIHSIPGIHSLFQFRHKKTGGTENVRYCYTVWMRHLITAYESGMKKFPVRIVELGPGDSLGVGIAALISGSEKYIALDVEEYSSTHRNLKMFNGLVELFKNKTPIPASDEFPKVRPTLKTYDFPSHILTDAYLEKALDENRLSKIRDAITALDSRNKNSHEAMMSYYVQWNSADVKENKSVDLIISQAVLQHVEDLEFTYACMNKWLKQDGIISHGIDFGSMGCSDRWDGHWTYSDWEWKIVRGRKKFLINREPYSTHEALLKKNGFEIISEAKSVSMPTLNFEKELKGRYKKISTEVFSISGVFFQAIKKVNNFMVLLMTKTIHGLEVLTSELAPAVNAEYLFLP